MSTPTHRDPGKGAGNGHNRRSRGRRASGEAAPEPDFDDDELGVEAPQGEDTGARIDVVLLKQKSIAELTAIGEALGVENVSGLRKQGLLFAILQAETAKRSRIYAEGVLETLPDGFGFLRAPDQNDLAGQDDIYVSPSQI